MIKREIPSSPFGLFLITISLSFLIGLYRLKISRYCRWYDLVWSGKFRSNWQQIEDILLTFLCVVSIVFIDVDASLFELTALQIVAMLVVCRDYASDLGKCFILISNFSWPRLRFFPYLKKIDTTHHIFGLVGCGYLFWTCCGGSVIVRMLLDVFTNSILHLRSNYPQWFFGSMFHQRLCNSFFWIISIVIRLIYYPLVLVQSLLILGKSMSTTDQKIHYSILLIFFTYWLAFSTIYHIIWIRDAYNSGYCSDVTLEKEE